MGLITSVSIQKGGPGKTTICRNLGEEVAQTGRKVLLIDNDPQGNLTKSIYGDELPDAIMKVGDSATTGGSKVLPGTSNTFWLYEKDEVPEPLHVKDSLYIIGTTKHLAEMGTRPADSIYEFKDKVEMLAQDYDDIFIDCPPAAGTLQLAAHAASDFVLIPTELSEDSIDGLKEQVDSASLNRKRLNPRLNILGIVVNGKDSHKINIEEYHHGNLRESYKDLLFNTVITHSVKVSEARSFNKTVRAHAPSSVQAQEFLSLRDEYIKRITGAY